MNIRIVNVVTFRDNIRMSYLSIEFFAAFLPFFALYWSQRAHVLVQNRLILIASYILVCSYSPFFLLELLLYSAFIYFAARKIQYYRSKKLLKITIAIAIAHLFLMKYLDFFRIASQNLLDALGITWQLPAVEILLPIGISYYTFHSITYLVAAWRVQIVVEKPEHLGIFLAFFPTLIAGPICRATEMLPQFASTAPRAIGDSGRIFILLISALIKVLWLSAWLAEYWVNPILGNPEQYSPTEVLAALYAYTLQIYLDFSGYTDLVTAFALLLGIRIPKNFDMPYAATNLRDFWRRWHISLSSWIRDYLYIPLGGNRKGFWRTQANLMISMLLCGLWHGASSNYLIWGGMHATALILINLGERLMGKNAVATLSATLARYGTIHYVVLTWAVFYSNDHDNTRAIFHALTGNISLDAPLAAIAFVIIFNLIIYFYPRTAGWQDIAAGQWRRLPWHGQALALIIVLIIIVACAPAGIPNFLYSNF
ncbi:MAG: MBOAT family O-acyltransferase [Cardiobacteriaceae bacterium]|nr:MBOAT family O-acyltransferase [Cardiobacteriaceae bacterium]